MSRLLFENSKAALAFAGIVVVGAAIFAGASSSMDFSKIGDGTAAEEQRQTVAEEKPAAPATPPANQPAIADFAPDEELIDSAEGFDPAPSETYELADEGQAEEDRPSPRNQRAGNSGGGSEDREPRSRPASTQRGSPARNEATLTKRTTTPSGQTKWIK